MANLTIKDLVKTYIEDEIIHDINFDIQSGEFIVLVGPSGCGKSTILRMIAGLEEVTSGQIFIDDVDVTNTAPSKRGVAMVFQSYALYPHMTVRENLSFGLKNMKLDKAYIDQHITHVADILQLSEYLDRLPSHLSGGQRQRVAIGRTIVRDPKIFLFDEPLSNLDTELRVQMRHELSKLHKKLKSTMIYVTHDQIEAMTLADRIVVLDQGRISQMGTPLELYNHPKNIFTASFIGSPKINLLDGKVMDSQHGKTLVNLDGGINICLNKHYPLIEVGDTITLGLRPEHIHAHLKSGDVILEVQPHAIENLGDSTYVYAKLQNHSDIRVKLQGQNTFNSQNVITLGINPNDILLFDQKGDAIIPSGTAHPAPSEDLENSSSMRQKVS
ncbi:ABC transporter ATP-binding protein [Paremcibacter congregatus]|uniref:ABC transporter domain-containing protein n=1 Tax=Paremcibacter congregatus TaxID=2043170 RepID=A0A2G4YRX1_9PROT|nr:sn-glycerol-3-phosphate ABC transporter ATP-binding protein UgpC [Paremcibacter congregatus]PHZ85089.1 hypothetical protein CRD36_08585 [Paremcibacter congregatus]QDE27961.1 sn-glycerol-3-phosphate ABC transporter ATP-binding protein UgpC [Paremcibacter congregatus]